MSPLSVLALNYEFPPLGGGGATAHQALLREMTSDGCCRVCLITAGMENTPHEETLSESLTIKRVPVGKKDARYWRRIEVFRYLVRANREVHRVLKHANFDVCHAFFGIPAGWIAYRHRKALPYVISLRGSDVPGYNQRFSLDHGLLRPLVRRSWQAAHTVVANSEGLRHQALQAFPDIPIDVIPNGIDTDMFRPRPHAAGDTSRLVTVARLIPRKGIHLLLEALSKSAYREWRLAIIGDGPERERLSALAKRAGIQAKVEFYGDKDRSEIAEILPGCDLFVLPSLAEGMSNAALEAMACGLPVLLTQTGGSDELVKGNGRVVPSGDVEALRRALEQLLAARSAWPEMGGVSREIAQSLSWSATAEKYLALLKRAAGKT